MAVFQTVFEVVPEHPQGMARGRCAARPPALSGQEGAATTSETVQGKNRGLYLQRGPLVYALAFPGEFQTYKELGDTGFKNQTVVTKDETGWNYSIDHGLPTYLTLKEVKKRWGHGQEDVFPITQFEKIWGDMSMLPDVDCGYFVVPRLRGQQLKDPAQLDAWLRDGSADYIRSLCSWS